MRVGCVCLFALSLHCLLLFGLLVRILFPPALPFWFLKKNVESGLLVFSLPDKCQLPVCHSFGHDCGRGMILFLGTQSVLAARKVLSFTKHKKTTQSSYDARCSIVCPNPMPNAVDTSLAPRRVAMLRLSNASSSSKFPVPKSNPNILQSPYLARPHSVKTRHQDQREEAALISAQSMSDPVSMHFPPKSRAKSIHLAEVAAAVGGRLSAAVAAANGADALAGGNAAAVHLPVVDIGLLLDVPLIGVADAARGQRGAAGLDIGPDVAAVAAEAGAAARGRRGLAAVRGMRAVAVAALGRPIGRGRAGGAPGIGGRAGRRRGAVAAVRAADDRVPCCGLRG